MDDDTKDAKFVQWVILTLSDGRKLTYFGRYQFPVEDVPTMQVVDVAFTPPRELPADYKLEEIRFAKEEPK